MAVFRLFMSMFVPVSVAYLWEDWARLADKTGLHSKRDLCPDAGMLAACLANLRYQSQSNIGSRWHTHLTHKSTSASALCPMKSTLIKGLRGTILCTPCCLSLFALGWLSPLRGEDVALIPLQLLPPWHYNLTKIVSFCRWSPVNRRLTSACRLSHAWRVLVVGRKCVCLISSLSPGLREAYTLRRQASVQLSWHVVIDEGRSARVCVCVCVCVCVAGH